jgi:hypothetical protein
MNTHLGELADELSKSIANDTDRRDLIRKISEALPTVEQWRREIGQYQVPVIDITAELAENMLNAPDDGRFNWSAAERDLVTGKLA